MLVELHHDRVRLRNTNLAFGTELARLDSVAPIPGGGRLVVGGEAVELQGLGAAALTLALARHRAGGLHALGATHPQDRLHCSGAASWHRPGGPAEGQLVLGTSSLRFLPWPSHLQDPGADQEPEQLPEPAATWPRDVLAGARWCPQSGQLRFTPPGHAPVVLSGPGAVLAALCHERPSASVLALPACRGSAAHPQGGLLVLDTAGLRHVCTSAPSPSRMAHLAWSEVAELQAVGGPLPLLHLHHPGGRLTLQVSETALVAELVRERIDRALRTGPCSQAPRPVGCSGLLGPADAAPMAVSPGRLTVDTGRWRFGLLELHRKELRFAPRPGATAGPQRIPISVVSRSEAGARALVLRTRQRSLRFFVADPAFVDRYWDEARTPDRVFHPADHRAAVFQRLCAPAGTVRVWADDQPIFDSDRLRLVMREGRLELHAPDLRGPAPAPGRLLRVQVFHPDGIYELTSPVPRPAPGETAPQPAAPVATLELPRMVLRFDKRQERRMVVWAPVRIHRSDGREPCLGLALNLSASGAALRAYGALEAGDEVVVDLQLDHDQTVQVPAQVVRHDPVRDCWGVRFGALPEAARRTLLRLAEEHEQQELAHHRPRGSCGL
jgi:hypothetical protein